MLSKNQHKLITSLGLKKYRAKYKLFIVEGVKGVDEFLNSKFQLESLFCTEDQMERLKDFNPQLITTKELENVSNLSTPNKVLAIFKIPDYNLAAPDDLIVALDGVNDPGNLGTIIRLCDWFGIQQIVCSKETVDCFNPKVVMATMGSLARVAVVYIDLREFLKESNLPVYGAYMDGDNIYKSTLKEKGILVMGNEANGISKEVEEVLTHKIAIPKYNQESTIESLNVATATAILLNEFRRS